MTRPIALAAAAAFALTGCIASPRRGYAGPTYAQPGNPPVQSPAQPPAPQNPPAAAPAQAMSDVPLQALNQVDRFLRGQGYSAVGPAQRNANMPTNGMMAYGINAQAGVCYTIVAIARQGADLNLVVVDPQGRTVAHNVDPGPRPWATVCPTAPGRTIARLQMASGSGEYYYAVYQGPPQRQPNLAALFGTTSPQAQPVEQAQLDGTTRARLAALDQRLSAEGYQRVGDPRGEVFEGENNPQTRDRDFAVSLQQGSCYAFATLGGEGTRDTDVFLVDGGNQRLEADTSTQLDALIRHCPEQSGNYTLRSRLYRGQGPVFTAVYVRGQQPQTNQVIAARSTAGAGLEENFRLVDSDFRARGYRPYGDRSQGQLQQRQTRDFELELEGGKCYAVVGVGDNGVRDLDLVLLDRRQREVARDVATDARPTVRVCPSATGTYTVQVRMRSGSGSFFYGAYRWPRGTRGPFGLAGLIYVRLAEMTAILGVDGYEPDVDTDPGRGQVRQRRTATHNVRLTQGQCYAVLAVGGDGISDLDVSLMKGRRTVSTGDTSTAFASVRHCAEETGRYTVSVRAASGSGAYFYQMFRRTAGQ